MPTAIAHNDYVIGTGNPGIPLLELHLKFSLSEKTVVGVGNIKKFANPAIDMNVNICGEYTTIMIGPDVIRTLVLLESKKGFKCQMVLEDDLSQGYSNYQFTHENGVSQKLEHLPTLQLDKYSQFSPKNSWHRAKFRSVPFFV